MKLFSKRNPHSSLSSSEDRRLAHYGIRKVELLSLEARNRLTAEIRFLSSSNDFLEWFILFEDQRRELIYFDEKKIDSFSLSELGYSLTDYFSFNPFKMIELERKIRFASSEERSETYFDDSKLFDLAEITILFAKENKRKDVIKRFNTIFLEENSNYHIVEHLITKKSGETLKGLLGILKDDGLRRKLDLFFQMESNDEFVHAAKLSADLVNIIFSGAIKDGKPQVIAALKNKLTEKLIDDSATKVSVRRSKLDSHIDDLLKVSKNLSNDIYDVRHTEQSTLQLTNDNIYKLIASYNISIVELVITTLKDDYVMGDNWESIKKEYIKKYKIDPTLRKTIVKKDAEPPINFDDIPF